MHHTWPGGDAHLLGRVWLTAVRHPICGSSSTPPHQFRAKPSSPAVLWSVCVTLQPCLPTHNPLYLPCYATPHVLIKPGAADNSNHHLMPQCANFVLPKSSFHASPASMTLLGRGVWNFTIYKGFGPCVLRSTARVEPTTSSRSAPWTHGSIRWD